MGWGLDGQVKRSGQVEEAGEGGGTDVYFQLRISGWLSYVLVAVSVTY